MSDPQLSRGYRNRNPGNLDWSAANDWQGQVGIEPTGTPPRFCVFESHEYGIRALAVLLTTYQDRYGLRRVREIINRWAPASENDTAAYIAHLAQLTHKPAETVLDLHDFADLRALVVGIVTHECGGNPYDDVTIDNGLRLAGVPRPVVTLADAAVTQTGVGALQVGSVTAAVGILVPLLQSLAGLPPLVGMAVVIVAALGVVGYVLLQRLDARAPAP